MGESKFEGPPPQRPDNKLGDNIENAVPIKGSPLDRLINRPKNSRRRFFKDVAVKAAKVLAAGTILSQLSGEPRPSKRTESIPPPRLPELSPAPDAKEVLQLIPTNSLMIDFAPAQDSGTEWEYFDHDEQIPYVPETIDLIKLYLKTQNVSLQANADGSYDLQSAFDEMKKEGADLSNNVFLLMQVLNTYQGHGVKVVDTMRKGWNFQGFESKPFIAPFQSLLDMKNIEFVEDKWNNKGIKIITTPETIIKSISEQKDKHPEIRAVNLSLQVGDVIYYYSDQASESGPVRPLIMVEEGYSAGYSAEGVSEEAYFPDVRGNKFGRDVRQPDGGWVFIPDDDSPIIPEVPLWKAKEQIKEWEKQTEEWEAENARLIKRGEKNPGTHFEGAYRAEAAAENLQKLSKVAEEFPDMVIVAAMGNYNDEPWRAQFSLPPNLILVGEFKDGKPRNDIFRSDGFYIDNTGLELPIGSSYSAPIVHALVTRMLNDGVSVGDIKAKLAGLTNPPLDFEVGDTPEEKHTETVRVIDPAKALPGFKKPEASE